jgi:hypothetical protein
MPSDRPRTLPEEIERLLARFEAATRFVVIARPRDLNSTVAAEAAARTALLDAVAAYGREARAQGIGEAARICDAEAEEYRVAVRGGARPD